MTARIDSRLAFLARASALFTLVEVCEIDLDEAFQRLGLPVCETCGSAPCRNPPFCAACRRADRQREACRA